MSIVSHPVIDVTGTTSATLYFEAASDILVAEISEKHLLKNQEAYAKLSVPKDKDIVSAD